MTKDNNDGKGTTPLSHQNNPSGQSYTKAVLNMTKTPKKEEQKSKNDSVMKSPMTKFQTMDVPLTPKGTQSIVQEYKIVASKKFKDRLEDYTDLVKLGTEIMVVYMTHDQGPNKVNCELWKSWSSKGITDATNSIHTMASIGHFPVNKFKSIKWPLCWYLWCASYRCKWMYSSHKCSSCFRTSGY